jgi:Domain of unknown function (DUF222)/HNH endonuclease
MFDFGALVEAIDETHAQVGIAHRRLLSLIAQVDECEAWKDSGARDTAHWLSMRYGISSWKAYRWIAAARALDELPALSQALATGELGIDKVVELARFATRETEPDLIRWAREVACTTVRHRADLAVKVSRDDLVEVERSRFLDWWWIAENRRFGLHAELPAAQGAVVVRALERLAETIPEMAGEEDASDASARRADALVALCSARIASHPDPDRATVVIHAQAEGLETGTGGCEVQDGPVIDPKAVRRLLCNARVQTVLEDHGGNVLGLGRMSREPSAAMIRQVRYRDRGCRFPGCGTRAFTEAHHIVWWPHGGRTDLDNLLLICSFHHRLVHEYGWRVGREPDGKVDWFDPNGVRQRAGPSPPQKLARDAILAAAV